MASASSPTAKVVPDQTATTGGGYVRGLRLLRSPDMAQVMSIHALPSGLTIGREPGDGVWCVSDAQISRMHARFEEKAGQIVLRDLDSSNGVSVNGQRVK